MIKDTKDRDLRVMEGILRLMEQISTFVKDYRGGPVQTETRIRRKYSADSESSDVIDEGEQMMKQLQQLSDVILVTHILFSSLLESKHKRTRKEQSKL